MVTVSYLRTFVRLFRPTELAKLPRVAQVYVASVAACGMVVFAVCIRWATFDRPALFLAVLVLSPIMAAGVRRQVKADHRRLKTMLEHQAPVSDRTA